MMMICPSCNRILETEDLVKAEIKGRFYSTNNANAYALDQSSIEMSPGTLRHADCNHPKSGDQDDE